MLILIYFALGSSVSQLRSYIAAQRDLSDGVTLIPILLVVFIGSSLLSSFLSIGYTVGGVVGSLAMVESVANEHQSALLPAHSDLDERMPITANLRSSIRLLQRAGASRWRGAGHYTLYSAVHFIFVFWSFICGAGILGVAAISAGVTIVLARQHMLCTHRMVVHPAVAATATLLDPWMEYRILFLPSLIHAVVQQGTILLFLAPFRILEAEHIFTPDSDSASYSHWPSPTLLFSVQILFLVFLLLILSLILLLHTSIVLTRIEAALLPAEMTLLGPFDRQFKAVFGSSRMDVDFSWSRSAAILRTVWRSSWTLDTSLRVGKVYAKMLGLQSVVLLVGLGSGFIAMRL
ncbi:hypothetical protein FB45DRAFT_1004561 [Roridomyces roridus]|uniref:Uncharacterized protein n=1 Tax=Roridomyces roridus TaxID=1738132 RepID=A0AAD7BQ49_9AGAR|nr:hypothetical protein FB45DRAFT_1004561 [Roridomyces roridus]